MDAMDMVAAVKTALGITGDFHDSAIEGYINEVNAYLTAAGVPPDLINTQATVGVVSRGVADLWNYGTGSGRLSRYFYERVIQLSAGSKAESEVENNGD